MTFDRARIFVAVLLLLAAASAAHAQVIPGVGFGPGPQEKQEAYYAQVRNELLATRQTWAESLARRDTAALEALFDPSASSFVSGIGPGEARGPHDIVHQMLTHPTAGAYVSLTTADFTTTGDLAVESGYLVAQPGRGAALHTTLSGSYVLVYLRDFRNRWHIRQQVLVLRE